MRTGYADRLWAIGGAVGAALLVAVGWFLLISPQYGETAGLRDEAATTRTTAASLKHRTAQLRKENAELPRYLAQLQRDREALPTTSGLSDFLRELQTASANAGVSVAGLTIGAPSEVTKAGSPVYGLPITVTAVGSAAKLGRFLHQLQQVQPRAVLIGSGTLAGNGKAGLRGPSSLTLSLQVFVAQPTGTGPTAATPSASPSAPK